jgi:hypothetical protein
LLLFGSLVSRLGLESFYAGAAMAAAGAVMVFASLAIKDTKR